MAMVVCTTFYGKRKLVSKDTLKPRHSAYGVVVDQGRLLLVNTRSTGKWSFPGGRREAGESDVDAAMREVREETGVVVAIDDVLVAVENYWYDDTAAQAYHQHSVYFRCRPLTTTLSAAMNPDDQDEAERPSWVPLDQLTPDDFQGIGGEVFKLLS